MYKIDLQLGFEPEIETESKWDVLDEYAQNGFNLVALAMSTDNTSLESAIKFIAGVRTRIEESKKYCLVQSFKDIEEAKKQHRLGLTFLLQGPNPLDKNLDMLNVYHALGVRSIILAYNIRNAFADGCIEPDNAGLSRLGRALVARMNELGLIIDCSHTGHRSSMEAIEQSTQPVIFSHSNVYQLHPHPRNLKDDQIKAIAQSGGLIGINGNAGLLGKEPSASLENYVQHIDYITQLVGPKHVALGTDQVYFPELFNQYMEKQAIFYSSDYKKGIPITQDSYIKPSQIQSLIDYMSKKGYSQPDITNILGQNYLNIIQKIWK